ncbi:MAG TPA: substrate-binding domain-containing protein, partial [Gammaproteobacteria bacterium]|nr:substrate-binding domain-containing protein [Gammaproteobacteria bacterium]
MRASLAALLAGALALTSSIPAQEPGRLGVMASNGVRSVLEELRPRAEAVAGMPLALELSTARTLKDRLEAGEAFDVAILTPELIDALIASGTVRAESRVEFARVGVGVGVRPGFPETGLATADDLRRVLLAARSVAYGGSGQSRETNEAALDALGIADAVRPKVRLTGAGEAPRLVASGDVDVVLTLGSELVNEPGLRYL